MLVTIFLMPMMMAPVVAGLVWYYLYNSHLRLVPLAVPEPGHPRRQIDPRRAPARPCYGIVIVDVWQWTPLITLITLAGLKRVPRDQLEANMVDGAGAAPQLLRDHAAQSLSRSC